MHPPQPIRKDSILVQRTWASSAVSSTFSDKHADAAVWSKGNEATHFLALFAKSTPMVLPSIFKGGWRLCSICSSWEASCRRMWRKTILSSLSCNWKSLPSILVKEIKKKKSNSLLSVDMKSWEIKKSPLSRYLVLLKEPVLVNLKAWKKTKLWLGLQFS